jgi:hypothetical protein
MNRFATIDPDPYPGFVPIKSGRYYTLAPNIPKEQIEALGENLGIPAKVMEMKKEIHQRLEMVPHEKCVNQLTYRVYDFQPTTGFCLGVMFFVTTEDDNCNYTICLMPTQEAVEEYEKDMDEMGKKLGMAPVVWKN